MEDLKNDIKNIKNSILLLKNRIENDGDIIEYLKLVHKYFSKLEIDLDKKMRENINE